MSKKQITYTIDSIVKYQTITGKTRVVWVTGRDEEEGTFTGMDCYADLSGDEVDVWGYDSDILEVGSHLLDAPKADADNILDLDKEFGKLGRHMFDI